MRLLILLCSLAISIPASAQEGMTPAKQLLFHLTNQHRAENGLPPLTWDSGLARAAQAHAERMSREGGTGNIQHQYPGEPDLMTRASQAGAHFSTASENIGATTGQLADIDSGWMQSSGHRANILNPQLNAVGIGVVQVQGTIYAVQDFSQTKPTLSRDEIESRAQQVLRERGLKVDPSDAAKQAARNSCNSSNATPEGVVTAMRLGCTDLSLLPDLVLKTAPQAKDHALAVGACTSPQGRESSTTYNVSVLMYSDGH